MGKLIATTQATEGLAGYCRASRASGRTWSTRCRSTSGPHLSGDLEWNATLLEGYRGRDPKLKYEVDGDLFMHGSGEFAYALAEKGLIDEYEVYLNPLVWGRGKRPRARRQRNRPDGARRREAVRLRVVLVTYLPAS